MKRALLLTYHVPPRAAIASVRVGNLILALRQHGWEVIPVVPDFGDVKYEDPVRTTGVMDFKQPMRRLFGVRSGQTTHERFNVEHGTVLDNPSWTQRAIRFGHTVTAFANGRFGWYGPGTTAISQMLVEERFNAIISTSPPEATHIVAARVAGGIPWIADLRDPWLRSDVFAGPGPLRALDRVLEPRVLAKATALTTVSEPLAAQLRERYPQKEVYAVPNAFSEAEWYDVPFVQPKFATFLHAGQLYNGLCDPRPFFEAMAHLLREGLIGHDEVRVDFYGHPERWLEDAIAQYGLRRVVKLQGIRPRNEILRLERKASRLLIFLKSAHGRTGPEERGNYSGKLFEYFGARRKIIVVGGPEEVSVVDEVLRQTGAGERHISDHALRDAILQAVKEWRSGITAVVPPSAVAPFELRHFGDRFAQILERCTSKRSIHGVT